MNYNDLAYQVMCISCISLTFKRFEPIQKHIRKLLLLPGKVYQLIGKILTCSTCISLWTGLIITQNIYHACIISVFTTYISWATSRF